MKLLGDKIISYTSRNNALPLSPKEVKKGYIEDAFSDAKFLDWQKPEWNSGGFVHNWHNYSIPALEIIWDTFTDDQKKIIAATLDNAASKEHWD